MAANDWAARVQHLVDQEAAVMESTLRSYLYDLQQIDGTHDRSTMSFPAAVQAARVVRERSFGRK